MSEEKNRIFLTDGLSSQLLKKGLSSANLKATLDKPAETTNSSQQSSQPSQENKPKNDD